MNSRRTWVYVGLVLVCLGGCASDTSAKAGGAEGPAAKGEPIRPRRAAGEKVTELDTNWDGTPDVWDYTVEEKGPDGRERTRRVRRELDANWDGRVDLTFYYGAREEQERLAMDLDFDGKVDSVQFFEKGVKVRAERDLNGDGKTDEWVFYEKTQVARREQDANFDGRVDTWEYWENGQVDRFGEDLDGDGAVDKWTRGPPSE